ncbi:MAG TPA: AAA family ATPase [Stellaceae bacterium]|nr:AAA family ATPase [Stellaceae bacterium]
MDDPDLNGAPWKEGAEQENAGEAKRRFELVPFDRIHASPSAAYLVRHLIPREGLIVAWGPPKCGKTFWVFDLAVHIALGWDYRGRRIKQGDVVYIACEGERGLTARAEAFRRVHLKDHQDSIPFYLLVTKLDLPVEHRTLIADIKDQLPDGCACIVLDTLNRSIGGGESDDEVMGAYVRAADALRQEFGCAVIIVHHCGVDDRRPRGHTSLSGAADAQIKVTRDAADAVCAVVEFMKDGEAGTEIRSTLEVVELDPDEDGERVTSCVIKPADIVAGGAAKPKRKVPGAAQVALDLLRKAIGEAGEAAPASNHIPAGSRVVSIELWRQYCYSGQVAESDEADAKRKAFGRSVAKLQEHGLIGVWTDRVWLI